jgi:hypothetical protein
VSVDGILAYLTKKHGGNLHEKGIVTVTGNSIKTIQHLTDPLNPSGYVSWTVADGWFCYDFGDLRIDATRYAVQSCCNSMVAQSWTVEVSENGQKWVAVHAVSDTTPLKPSKAIVSYAMARAPRFRFLRVCHQGPNHSGAFNYHLFAFEVFGKLYE